MIYTIAVVSLFLAIFEYKTNRKARVMARRAFRRSCRGNKQRANKFTLLVFSIALVVIGVATLVCMISIDEYHPIRSILLLVWISTFVPGVALMWIVLAGIPLRDDTLELAE